jgi:hypothetical protein
MQSHGGDKEIEEFGESLSQYHFVYHKSNVD